MTVVEEERAAMKLVEAVEEERAVRRSPETAGEATSAKLPAEVTPGEVPGPELTTGKMSTEAADVASTEVSTTHVAAAEPTTPVAACQSRTAGQGERETDRQNQGGKPTNPGGQRPIDRRKRHEVTVVHSWRRVKGVCMRRADTPDP